MVRDLVLDASTFFAKNRFNFMLKLLEEEELQPDRIIIPSDLYHIFSKWIRGTSTEKGQERSSLRRSTFMR